MAAQSSDKFKLASNGSRPSPTTLTALKSIGASSITVGALTGWPTTTGVDFCIYTIDTSGNKVAGSQTDWSGTASGTTISNLTLRAGTDNGYAVGAIVEAGPVAAWADDIVSGINVEHDQDGTHGAITPTSVVSSGPITGTVGTFNSVVINGTATSQGWTALGDVPDTVTANSSVPKVFDLVFNTNDLTGTLSNGMKLQLARTVAAPSQCTDLEASSSQYFSRASGSVNGMSFTNNFVVSAWVKLESYGAAMTIASRYNGTSGFSFDISSSGQPTMNAYNAGAANQFQCVSYASLPLNKWVHVAAQIDMTVTTNTSTTNYIMVDGVDVAALCGRGGTNPTNLVQAGNLEIGGRNGGLQPFDGKIAQVAIYSAKVTQATILASINRTLTGSETNLVSAYSFNNSINDLNANANNLTAQNSAVATNADSPFANAVTAGSLEYAEVLNVTFSTNTTVTVRVPDGCQIPTSGGVSSVLYSTQSNPYGLPNFSNVLGLAELKSSFTTASTTDVQLTGLSVPVYVPTGRKIKLTTYSTTVISNSTATYTTVMGIQDGTVTNGGAFQEARYTNQTTTAGMGTTLSASTTITPTSGVHTFNTSARVSSGTGTYTGATNAVMYLQAELV